MGTKAKGSEDLQFLRSEQVIIEYRVSEMARMSNGQLPLPGMG